MVYVLDINGQPLMPTIRHGKVRRMLRSGQAKVVQRCPFTIQLMCEIKDAKLQDVNLGVDAGSRHIGVSTTTTRRVLYESDISLRNDIVDLMSTRRENRRTRRNRKTRYRKTRFNNRCRREKWLAPSVQQKVDTHLTAVRKVHEILPISHITVETAAFDLQKLKADIAGLSRPEGTDYQQGEQIGFWNVREYVLFRDGHQCKCCKGKSKDKILNVHHIQSRKVGGDAPNNLITLCETCHKGYHAGTVKLLESIKRGAVFKDAAFMGVMRWAFYNKLKEIYPNVHMTYGYKTKKTRIENGLSPKLKDDDKAYPINHVIDARCISGNPLAVSDGTIHYQKKVRRHNRQIHKMTILKGGIRKANQAEKYIKGYKLFDRVKYQGKEYIIFGRRTSGFFDIRTLGGEKVNKGSISYKKLRFIEHQQGYITERKVTA